MSSTFTEKLRVLNRRQDLRPLGTMIVGVALLVWYVVRRMMGDRPGPVLLAPAIGFIVASLVILVIVRRHAATSRSGPH